MPRTETVARNWLKGLGVLVAGNLNREEAETRLGAYAPLLAREFPTGAFTPDSLAAVGRECKFFPSFAELCAALSGWWKANRPPLAALAPPSVPRKRPPPDEQEIAAVREMVGGLIAELSEPEPTAAPSRLRNLVLSDEALLVVYGGLARQGSTAAQVRVAMLRAKLGRPPEGDRV